MEGESTASKEETVASKPVEKAEEKPVETKSVSAAPKKGKGKGKKTPSGPAGRLQKKKAMQAPVIPIELPVPEGGPSVPIWEIHKDRVMPVGQRLDYEQPLNKWRRASKEAERKDKNLDYIMGPLREAAEIHRTVRLWDLRLFKELRVFEGHTDWVKSLLFTGDSHNFVPISAGLDGMIISWDVATGRSKTIVKAHDGGINQLVLSGYCESLVSVGSYGAVKLWNPFTFKSKGVMEGHTDEVTTVVAFGKFIATGSADNKVKLWNPLINMEPRSSRSASNAASTSSGASAAATAAAEGGDTTDVVNKIELPLCRQTLTGHTLQVSDMCEVSELSLATSGWDSTVRLWEISYDFH